MTELRPPSTTPALTEYDAPQRVGSELRWHGRLDDGRRALVGMLAPELARDESVRRRWVREVRRVAELDLPSLCPPVAIGPNPDPTDPRAAPPWRLRLEPTAAGGEPHETLAAWILRRAPAPLDEVAQRVEAVARVIEAVHRRGEVLRDLDPRGIVVTAEGGAAWLTDVGLARVDILSTRTAASLVLEGSPYASPEQLRRTAIDQRSDLFGLGVILFHAIAGTLPFDEQPLLLRDAGSIPSLHSLRGDCPAAIDELVRRCLADEPSRRPESVEEVLAVLRGEEASCPELATAPCQSCGARMRPGQRLCLACGREAVQFRMVDSAARESWAVDLTKATEEVDFTRRLAGVLAPIADHALPSFNFIVGDKRMYSKEERKRRLALPVRLFAGMTQESAGALVVRMREAGLTAKVVREAGLGRASGRSVRNAVFGAVAVSAALSMAASFGLGPGFGLLMWLFTTIVAGVGAFVLHNRGRAPARHAPLLRLRQAPAALPASDPLVVRLSALLGPDVAADARDCVGEVALQVQRLVDHRARHRREAREIDVLTDPVAELVDHIVVEVTRIIEIDRGTATLDEGRLVRALAASELLPEAGNARSSALAGLDRLRELEQARAGAFHRLLEASRLLRRAVDLGLAVHDDQIVHEAEVAKALAIFAG